MNPPRLLDLFCGQGGAAVGYSRAGCEVVGVDVLPQPRYPFEFHQGDALEYLSAHWQEFDAFHASPPCQGYSVMHNLPWIRSRTYPLLILPTREAFQAIGKPYVIENVYGARFGSKGLAARGIANHGMQAGWLCGTMFGLPLYRHRLFETNFPWLAPGHSPHRAQIRPGRSLAGRARDIVFNPTNSPRKPGSWEVAYEDQHPGASAQAVEMVYSDSCTLGQRWSSAVWQPRLGNGAQAVAAGIGHASGWCLVAAVMGVEWMDRYGTSQAVPPIMTEYIGRYLRAAVMEGRGQQQGP